MENKSFIDGESVSGKILTQGNGNNSRLKSWQAYAFAAVVTAATLGLRLALAGQLKGRPTLIVFILPIMLSAYVGGLRAGLLATLLCYLGTSYYLLPPFNSFRVASTVDRWDVFFLMLAGVVISGLNEALHRVRHQADLATREWAEEDRKRFFALSQDVLCILGFDGYFKDLNPAWEKTLGYTKTELLITPFIEFIHPDDRQATLAEAEKVSGGKALIAFENRYRCKDGSYRWFQWSVTPVIADQVMYGVARDVTERRREEAASILLAAIVDASDDAIISKDLNGIITSWNKGAKKIFGYTAGEMRGTSIMRLIPAGREEEENQILGKIKLGESVEHFETLRRTKDGRLIDISVTASPITDSTGKVTGVSKVARDITERKLAEAARQASEERYRTLFENAPDGIVIADSQSYYLDANAAICQMLGYARVELIGLHASNIVVPAEIQKIEPALGAIKAGLRYHQDWQFRRKDGSVFHAEVIATVMPDGNLMGMIRDITARKLAEAALHESEERFRTMSNSMPQLAWIARGDGSVFWYNQRWYQYTGTTLEQMKGWGWQSVHEPKMLPRVMETWSAALGSQQPFEMEFPLRGADGHFRSFLTRVQPLKNSAGQVTQWFGTNTDVEALKQTEEKVRRLNAELEYRVIERTAQLEAANKELEAFSYSVSHDLRAPLRGVDGYIRMLKEDCASQLDAEGNRLLNVVSSEAKRMGRLIDDLLKFSRLGREQMESTPVDMTALAQDAFGNLTRAAPQSAPRFELKPLPLAQGDLGMLRQVFANLLSNAIKFTRTQPAPIIEVGGSSAGGEMTYYVKDNGVGFDEKYGHKLFGVFQRLHSEEEFDGTGVGLALIQRIIHRHGGKVWAQAKLNQGATFYFTLPIRKNPANE